LAFDILSDPDKRRYYELQRFAVTDADRRLEGFDPSEYSVMDSFADDTLEELLVGNEIPEHSTLATLFLDLEKTEVFIRFREAKYSYRKKDYRTAMEIMRDLVSTAPTNILYRYYLARAYASLGSLYLSENEYSEGIRLGLKRIPPQKLEKFQKELSLVRKKRNPILHGIASFFGKKKEERLFLDSQADMISEMNRAISNISRERIEREREREKEKRMIE